MLKYISAAIFAMAASLGNAQVQIIESQPIGGRSSPQARPQAPDAAGQSEIFFQLQMLQQEILELRGIVEQQSFELRQLKQQRLDDYLDLDRRLSQIAGASAQGSVPGAITPGVSEKATADISAVPATDAAQADELAAYRAAIDLVLKQRDFEAGADALLQYLKDFPSGLYVANSQYWLGQIYLQKSDQAQSKRWFQQMIDQHPRHEKVPEAKFKLAKLYHAEGQLDLARKLLQDVVDSNSAAASLAKDFLQQNF